jgi:hypothetical protein
MDVLYGLDSTELEVLVRMHNEYTNGGGLGGETSRYYSFRQQCCAGHSVSASAIDMIRDGSQADSTPSQSSTSLDLGTEIDGIMEQAASFRRIASFCNSRLPDTLRWRGENHTLTVEEATALANLPESPVPDNPRDELENKVQSECLKLEFWQDKTDEEKTKAATSIATSLGLSMDQWPAERWQGIASHLDTAKLLSGSSTSA